MVIGILPLMFLIMFALKLVGAITVSWWVVTSPLWGSALIVIAWVILMFVIAIIRS
jgi:hypothetical protein